MPSSEEVKDYLMISTKDLKLVSDYTRLSFNEVIELDCVTFKKLLKDAFVDMMSQSEDGREYLENCWILTQTTPEKGKLRERLGG